MPPRGVNLGVNHSFCSGDGTAVAPGDVSFQVPLLLGGNVREPPDLKSDAPFDTDASFLPSTTGKLTDPQSIPIK